MDVKPISGWPGYFITKDGEVISIQKLAPIESSGGYRYVNLTKQEDGKNKRVKAAIHRLVGQHFLENPDGKPCINHKDGCPGNNSHENLEWVTHQENSRHSIEILKRWPGLIRDARKIPSSVVCRGGKSPNAKTVYQFTEAGVVVQKFGSTTEAAAAVGCQSQNIAKACNVGWQCSGHYWSYTDTPLPRPVSKPENGNTTPVYQFTKEGEFVREHSSLKAAAATVGCAKCSMKSAVRGGTLKGFYWSRKKSFEYIQEREASLVARNTNKKGKK